jgi:4,5-dihydroxyphthalate decarboxylase
MRTVRLVTQPHDFLQPLLTGEVPLDTGPVRIELVIGDIRAAQADPAVDASELSMARHVCRAAVGDETWIGIPAFVRRGFSHRNWFVRKDDGVKGLSDLRGRAVGTNQWLASGNTWTRAVAREAGLESPEVQWTVGSINGGPVDRSETLPPFVGYAIDEIPLADRLAEGSLDALMCPDPPELYYRPNSPIRRLIPDYRTAEREFFQKTGAFPIHHMVGVRRQLFEEEPACLNQIYEALVTARRRWEKLRLEEGDTSPWLLADLEETMALMGTDWQRYGVEHNTKTLAYFCNEIHQQGFTQQLVPVEDLFSQFEEVAQPQYD